MKQKKQLNLKTATAQEIFNSIAKYMVNSKRRNSATRAEIAKHFDCSFNKASRLLNQFVNEGKLRRDAEVDDLYWLELSL